jgi:copper(I)-binding protein
MRHSWLALALAVMLAGLPLPVHAQQGGVQVEQVWSRAAMAGHQGAVYLTITNTGAPDTLTGAATPVAAMAEVHESINDHGVMKMRSVAAVPVSPGTPVVFGPGGLHIMLMGLKQPLREGERFPLTLSFAKAGPVTVTATVQKAGAAMPAMRHEGMGGTGGMGGMAMPGGTGHP